MNDVRLKPISQGRASPFWQLNIGTFREVLRKFEVMRDEERVISDWKLNDAKARVKRVIKKAIAEGPQQIVKCGKPLAFVIQTGDLAMMTPCPMDDLIFPTKTLASALKAALRRITHPEKAKPEAVQDRIISDWKLGKVKTQFKKVIRRAISQGPQSIQFLGEAIAFVITASDLARIHPMPMSELFAPTPAPDLKRFFRKLRKDSTDQETRVKRPRTFANRSRSAARSRVQARNNESSVVRK